MDVPQLNQGAPWPQTKCQFAGFVAWLIIDSYTEYFLGKTDKVRANSKVELIIMVTRFLIEKIRRKK